MNKKPLERKNYGSIPHLPGSRKTQGDHICDPGQARIATEQARDRHDHVIVQEKLDGSNVGVLKRGDELIPITRAGYRAETSPYPMHHEFARWVQRPRQYERFMEVLEDEERIVGEWMLIAHGTVYSLPHEPFVAFDLMRGSERVPFMTFEARLEGLFTTPALLACDEGPVSIKRALDLLGDYGHHGALDKAEGCVWRVERDAQIDKNKPERQTIVDFLVKYVRPDKVDGCYLPEITRGKPVYNIWIEETGDVHERRQDYFNRISMAGIDWGQPE